MPRVEIVVRQRRPVGVGGGPRRVVLGRFGSALAILLSALALVVVVGAALAVGYLVIGILLAALFLAVLVSVMTGVWRRLRR